MSDQPLSLLKSVFGYDQFRPLQREIIDNVLNKRDTLAIMPTGGGKSLCYQLPALLFPGLTLVVSPLISLMKDQVEQLTALGIAARFLNSSLERDAYIHTSQQVRRGAVKLLYVAPETLLTPRTIGLLTGLQIDCLTIDEAHCISEWGHDFRPEYRRLAAVRERFTQAVCLALTATATPRVRVDIRQSLKIAVAPSAATPWLDIDSPSVKGGAVKGDAKTGDVNGEAFPGGALPFDGFDFDGDYGDSGYDDDFTPAVAYPVSSPSAAPARPLSSPDDGYTHEFLASFDRPNLLIEVADRSNAAHQAVQLIRRYPNASGIIYCFSRKQVDELTLLLQRQGFKALPYHAGLSDDERRRNQEAFIHDEVPLIVATIAFGMGINKPNVRYIIHYDLPQSLEGYYQEIGRAGRDGERAHCLLLYNYGDAQKVRFFINKKEGTEREAAEARLQAMLRFAESDVCRRVTLLAHFGETYRTENCGMCDTCLEEHRSQVDLTIPVQKFLSCIKRTGEAFGAGHITDVLLGRNNEKIRKYNHHEVSTYGIGKELSQDQWMSLSRQLLQKGLLSETEHRGLALTAAGTSLLRERRPYLGILKEERKSPVTAAQPKDEPRYNQELLDQLFALRKDLASAQHVPAYVIFPDRTLKEMAAYYPQSLESLGQIHGIGQVKLQSFGPAFLPTIQVFCRQHGLQEQPRQTVKKESARRERAAGPAEVTPEMANKAAQTAELLNAGQTLDAIAEQFGVQPQRVLEYLKQHLDSGGKVRPEMLKPWLELDAHTLAKVMVVFEREGAARLRPVFDALSESVDYETLKRARLYYLATKSPLV